MSDEGEEMEVFQQETVRSIRERMIEGESGVLSPDVLNLIYERKLFKLFVPEALGGAMLPYPDALKVCEEASRVDGSFGWLVTIGSGGGFFTPYFQPQAARELLSDTRAVIAGSGYPSGTAKPVQGGYQVTGQWKYCSGAHHATIFTANAMMEGAANGQEMQAFIFLPEQVRIIEDWNAFGMRETGSHSIAVESAFVPQERTFNLMQKNTEFDAPVYEIPFLPFAVGTFAAVAIGVTKHFLEEARASSERYREAWMASARNRYGFFMDRLETVEQEFVNMANDFYGAVEKAWQVSTRHAEAFVPAWEEVSRCGRAASCVALECGHALFPLLGMHAVMEDSPINRIWRDLQTACQHSLLAPFE